VLISEVKGWHWAITWDNPLPADSSSMLKALGALGRLTAVQTKTTYLLAPKATVTWRQIRAAIVANLHPTKGNVFYVNLRTGKSFEWGSKTGHLWRKAV
jgi:hypothetical protein